MSTSDDEISDHEAEVDEEITTGEDVQEEEVKDVDVSPDLLQPYYFGCRAWHPKWLQVFAKKKFFTFMLCVFAFFEGSMVSGMTSVNLSSIEKRYHFTSTAVGVIPVCFDISVTLSIIFISYFGGLSHKPRWLGVSMMIMGVGSLIFASPQLFLGPYSAGSIKGYQYEICNDQRNYTSDCTTSDPAAYALFVLGKVLMGIGAAPLYTVAQAYLDEIVYPKFVVIHMGIYHTMGILGPVFGYGIGSGFLSLYVDPWADTSLTATDPAWVGAWWVSFAFVGVLSVIGAIPFLMFPRYLPDSHLVRRERAKEMAKIYSSKYANENGLSVTFKMFPVQIKRLVLNFSFLFVSLALGGLYLLSSGLVAFGPQYIETAFYLTATSAGFIAGSVGVSTAVFGVLGGAVVVYLCKIRGRNLVLIPFIITLVAIGPILGLMLHCPSLQVVGITVPDGNSSSIDGIDAPSCANDCGCLSNVFEPVCGADGLTYFSACRAGCTNRITDSKNFSSCLCVAEELVRETNSSLSDVLNTYSYATDGKCDVSCNLLAPFALGVAFILMLIFIVQIPIYYFTMRVVADDQRSLALGFQSAVWRTTGAIPGPIILGAIFDANCLKWEGQCHHRGNCWLYDNDRLGIDVMLFAIPVMLCVSVFFLLSCLTFPRRRKECDDMASESRSRGGTYIKLTGIFSRDTEKSQEDENQLLENHQ